MAIRPVRWPAFKDWRDVIVRTWKEAGDDNVSFLAAAVAFYAFLAFVPLLAATVLVYGLAAEPATVAEHIRKLFGVLPRDAAALIGDQLKGMTESPDSAKGWSLVVAIGLALYGASKGAGAIVTALNIAYEVKETRGFIKSTILSLTMTIGALVVLGVAAGAISVMGWVETLFPGFPAWAHDLLQILFWTAAAVAVGFALAAVYRFAPNRPDAPWVWISPGSAAATPALAAREPRLRPLRRQFRQLQRDLRFAGRGRRLPHLALPFRLHRADGRRAQFRAGAAAGGGSRRARRRQGPFARRCVGGKGQH